MRALVLDDDPAIGRLVRRIAAPLGFHTELATGGREFRSHYQANVPDLVLLDLQVEDGDGIEQLRFLSDASYRNPVILMSGFDERVLATAERLGRSLGLAIMATFNKPLRAHELRGILEQAGSELRPASPEGLIEAIERDEMVLEYLPIVTREPRTVRWLEALIRWNHPTRGRLSADQVIPLAESRLQVIDVISDWVIATAAREYKRLRDLGLPVPMAANISGKNLHDLDFSDRVHDRLRDAEVPAGHFCLEITETAACQDPARTMDILSRLRLKGVELAIDDFGTGYSSLKQLRQLPFSTLKIDRSFVADMMTSRDALAIVKSTLDLARNMELDSVAEGVDCEESAALLESLGVGALQGYLITRPLPAEQVAGWMRSWLPDDTQARQMNVAGG
jgi:EAL domain-containing protein (putative c-di-GMP-specific phosphodiesterase class I)